MFAKVSSLRRPKSPPNRQGTGDGDKTYSHHYKDVPSHSGIFQRLINKANLGGSNSIHDLTDARDSKASLALSTRQEPDMYEIPSPNLAPRDLPHTQPLPTHQREGNTKHPSDLPSHTRETIIDTPSPEPVPIPYKSVPSRQPQGSPPRSFTGRDGATTTRQNERHPTIQQDDPVPERVAYNNGVSSRAQSVTEPAYTETKGLFNQKGLASVIPPSNEQRYATQDEAAVKPLTTPSYESTPSSSLALPSLSQAATALVPKAEPEKSPVTPLQKTPKSTSPTLPPAEPLRSQTRPTSITSPPAQPLQSSLGLVHAHLPPTGNTVAETKLISSTNMPSIGPGPQLQSSTKVSPTTPLTVAPLAYQKKTTPSPTPSPTTPVRPAPTQSVSEVVSDAPKPAPTSPGSRSPQNKSTNIAVPPSTSTSSSAYTKLSESPPREHQSRQSRDVNRGQIMPTSQQESSDRDRSTRVRETETRPGPPQEIPSPAGQPSPPKIAPQLQSLSSSSPSKVAPQLQSLPPPSPPATVRRDTSVSNRPATVRQDTSVANRQSKLLFPVTQDTPVSDPVNITRTPSAKFEPDRTQPGGNRNSILFVDPSPAPEEQPVIDTQGTHGANFPSHEDAVIAVMGPTGAGKSSFINKATRGDGHGIGHSLRSHTTEILTARTTHPETGKSVLFVDTPGFDDTNLSDTAILEMIADWLEETYTGDIELAGIFYLHPISDNRMSGTTLKNLRMFQKLCGKDALQKVVLMTTFWDDVEDDVGPRREKELTDSFWRNMIRNRSQVARFDQTFESAWKAVDLLLERDQRPALLLQKELVDEGKDLPETQAGAALLNTLEKLLAQQQIAMKNLMEERKEENDPRYIRELEQEVADLEKKIKVTVEQMQSLKVPLPKRLKRLMKSMKSLFGNIFRS